MDDSDRCRSAAKNTIASRPPAGAAWRYRKRPVEVCPRGGQRPPPSVAITLEMRGPTPNWKCSKLLPRSAIRKAITPTRPNSPTSQDRCQDRPRTALGESQMGQKARRTPVSRAGGRRGSRAHARCLYELHTAESRSRAQGGRPARSNRASRTQPSWKLAMAVRARPGTLRGPHRQWEEGTLGQRDRGGWHNVGPRGGAGFNAT